MMGTLSLNDISTRQEKIAQQSRQAPSMIWTTLAHHIDLEWLHEAYRRTRKDGAVGVDGVRAREYEAALQLDPEQPRGRHGRARSLAAMGKLDDALVAAQESLRLAPREAEFHHTLA